VNKCAQVWAGEYIYGPQGPKLGGSRPDPISSAAYGKDRKKLCTRLQRINDGSLTSSKLFYHLQQNWQICRHYWWSMGWGGNHMYRVTSEDFQWPL